MAIKIRVDDDEIILKVTGKRAELIDTRSITQSVSGDGNIFTATGDININVDND